VRGIQERSDQERENVLHFYNKKTDNTQKKGNCSAKMQFILVEIEKTEKYAAYLHFICAT